MGKHIIILGESADLAVIGGKAVGIARLLSAGLLVPHGFVVSVYAYREHVERAFSKLPDSASNSDKAIAIMSTEIADELKTAFNTTWPSYIKSAAAIRSSATAEDTEKASYAGQFKTILNVRNSEAGLLALKQCWASVWSLHAMQYGSAVENTVIPSQMAVIVQEMINPEFAGVAFTIEPVTTSGDVFYAEWVVGLGEALVSGERIDGRIWFDHRKTVLRVDYLQDDDPPSELWEQLATHLSRIATTIGSFQDVEWAWSNKKLFLLQSRPIVQAKMEFKYGGPPPWVLPGRPKGGWTDDQRIIFDMWDEYNLPTVSPLEFTLHDAAISQSSIDMIAKPEYHPNIEQVMVLLHNVPLAIDPAGRLAPPSSPYERACITPDLRDAIDHWEQEVTALRIELQHSQTLSDERLFQLLQNLSRLYRDAVATRLLRMDERLHEEDEAKNKLSEILESVALPPDETIEKLQSGVDHETHRMIQALDALAIDATHDRKSEAWRKRVEHFVDRFGYMEGYSSTEEIIAQIDELMKSTTTLPMDRVAQARRSYQTLYQELSNTIHDTEAIKAFQAAVSQLRSCVALRENSKAFENLPRPLLKRLIADAAIRLRDRGILTNTEDIWLFTVDELKSSLFNNRKPSHKNILLRSELLKWKSTKSWLPNGFLGEEYSRNDRLLRGISASPGSAEGPACIIEGPAEFDKAKPGDIVVARSTNPVWTVLFNRIAAILVENGSRISHAAIVAREFGIPAVVGIRGATSIIVDGEPLHLDGTAGEVIRLDIPNNK